MRKLTAALALSTSALAVSSIYLWSELQEARTQVQLLSQHSAAAAIPHARATESRTDPDRPGIADAAATVTSSPEDIETARQRVFDEDFRKGSLQKLAQLADPTMRAQMLEEWKEANLPNKENYARYLHISDVDAERLIDVLAERFLAQTEAYARCMSRPPCDHASVARDINAAQQTAIAELLGADRAERFEQYTYSNVERGLVTRFLRDRIPASSQLSEEDSERFIEALAGERRLVETDIKQRGLQPYAWQMEGVAFAFEGSPFEPGRTAGVLKEAADYNRRIHARAKEILTSTQLAAFEKMQDASIVGLKFWLRQQERDMATRASMSSELPHP